MRLQNIGTGQLPLTGAILCCTSIAPEQRTQLATIGSQMGATIKLDLTSDVTHLIVGSTDSAKYRYVAKSREDVKVLSPAWLEALREVWMEGDDNVDVAALEAEHRLPTFFGLKICLTGFDNPEQRRYIQETVDANGAEYHGDLTKAVTHLIAATPTGKKYEHAVNWRMKIVSLEWFQQSLDRGMVLEEALFDPRLPIEERGHGAWDRRQSSSPGLGKRVREEEPSQALNPFRRKLRRSASTKMGSQSEALWAGITAASLERPHDERDDWTEDSIAKHDTPREHTPATRPENYTNPEDDAPPEADPAYDPRQPLPAHTSTDTAVGIFQGRIVFPHGFDDEKTHILRQHLQDHGANVPRSPELNTFSPDDLRRGFLVVPHDAVVDLSSLPERAGSLLSLVTNWWVERCLYGKCLVNPADDVLSRPFDNHSIGGFSDLTVNSTAFVGIELLHVTRVVAIMGATYDEQLSAKTSVMVCNTERPNEQKLKFATNQRIPAVHATWLWECLRTSQMQPYEKYQLNTFSPHPPQKSRLKPNPQPSVEVPTARLSTEESFDRQQKKAQAVRKAVKPRGKHQPRALDLALSVDPTPESTRDSLTHTNTTTNHSNFDDDGVSIPALDGSASLPLQDISANSPRRPSTTSLDSKPVSRARSSSAESLIRAAPKQRPSKSAKQPSPDSVIPVQDSVIPAANDPPAPPPPQEAPEEKDYSDILAQLRANRKPLPSPADQTSTRRRGRRQLGRATSTRSNDSTAESSGQLNLDGDDDREMAQEYQPSQELGWDSPGAAKAREQMIKRLGGRVTEKSIRVEGIGVVRDVASEGAGGRVSRKRRERGF
ncbi:hypothetical protein FB567DRAFT_446512 [Paraphoma chrysanthemicola]|uniref:BRCT domain-containing protein n=1 Tax=Paraphoma chrysanthemicola TaxID=798071 RepID=A0A8K0VWJ6_9PLEO|nr:hypothetical protein FB567DRAFT_446512 [Paraphoma chrysanthemicola]